MKTSCHPPAAATEQAAFTKVELLVVIAVVALLAGLRLCAATGLKNQAKIAQCASNLRQLGLSMMLYGSDNAGKLPVQPANFGGNWLWDMEWNVGNTLNRYGTPQELMYCPGTAPRFSATNNEELYEYYSPGRIHVIGYAPTLPGSVTLDATNVNSTITPQPIQFRQFLSGPLITLPPPIASQRVLVADATITHPSPTNYVMIYGGYKVPHVSPHLDGFIPAGGNLGMLDGHVEWRSFNQMHLRTDNGAMTLYYW